MQTLAQRYVAAIETGNVGLRCRLEKELDDETTVAAAEKAARYAAPNAMLKVALWYARRGVAVFPCEHKGKAPIARVGEDGPWIAPRGLKDATTDEAKIVRWWTAVPDANIGAPTGITFDVIDLDGKEAVDRILLADDPPKLPPKIGHSLTTRQAGHHLFIAPTGRGNAANLYPHVDYRGVGGYVILPPSIGANGRRYEWAELLEVLK